MMRLVLAWTIQSGDTVLLDVFLHPTTISDVVPRRYVARTSDELMRTTIRPRRLIILIVWHLSRYLPCNRFWTDRKMNVRSTLNKLLAK
jgi:hypothetical protein